MPTVMVTNTKSEIEVMMLRSLLFSLQINDVPIETECGGRAVCGRCAVKILKGKKALSPITKREQHKLTAMKAGDDLRLACQAHPGKDVEIEIVNFGKQRVNR